MRRSGQRHELRATADDAELELHARAHDLVGGTVLGGIGDGHGVGQRGRCRRVDDHQFGLLACRGLVGAHQHLAERRVVLERRTVFSQAHRVRRGLVGLEVGVALVDHSAEVGGVELVSGLGGHAAGTTATDHSRRARALQFQRIGLGRGMGGVGDHQCASGHCREKRFLHGSTPACTLIGAGF